MIASINPQHPVLIAGPTAAGKSALALDIAEAQGGIIVNADALQVYRNWHVLTARPDAADLSRAPHALYGHVDAHTAYSVGQWLREVTPYLTAKTRPIIVGGTGLYFTALTEGLADIPATPPAIRARGEQILARPDGLATMLAQLDAATRAAIDTQNPARVARAWEVLSHTGRGLRAWQDDTPPPLLPLSDCTALVLNCDRDWLRDRIARRFDLMLAAGALDEARANLAGWDPAQPSSKAIGARELIAHLQGETDLASARAAAITASQQYAKRQRSWFRARMGTWQQVAYGAHIR
ncbi:MAG TPA: tRNA (adenosine(37)-N6)-dimethylallyltransferase MiaA [Aliiroseovarius sp.]|nr:tRNA (adenosine(37)-N6)-dimethylallyltransferase MiaA [Aliiroseovarius sp.]